MSPFPVFCTEWQQNIKKYINKIMNNKNNYDQEPVFACKHCGTLVVPNQYEIDEDGNEICQRCNSVNDVKEFKNIFEYNKEQKIKPKY
jgi:predicted metal-binding protein